MRRLNDIAYCFRLPYRESQQEVGDCGRKQDTLISPDERSENKALRAAMRQLNHQIASTRVALYSLKQELSVLKRSLVTFALRRKWVFLPADFCCPSLSFHDLVAVYFRAGYRPTALSPSEIQKLPVEPTDATLQEEHCCICLLDFESVVKRLPCGHRFHVDCIGRWLEVRNACPLCVGEVVIN